MPRRRPQLAIEGRVREDWEYLDWADRILQSSEDLRWTTDEEAWKDYVSNFRTTGKGVLSTLSGDPDMAERQLHSLWNKGVSERFLELEETGISVRVYEPTPGFRQVSFHDAKGRFVAHSTVLNVLRGMR